MQKNKSVAITNIIFAVVGSVFIIIGAIMFINTITFKANADEVMALITDIRTYGDDDHEVDVEYEYEGFTFYTTLDTYSSGMYEGKWIPILVNRDDPTDIVEPGTNLVIGIVFMVLGLIAVLAGGISVLKDWKNKKKIEMLKNTGKRLQATIDRITVNERIAVNGQHPYIIWCSYVDEFSGVRFEFKSENIWNDPYMVCDEGSTIDVWVKADDYLEYIVDVDSLVEYSIRNDEW